jgi:hypothetical protein
VAKTITLLSALLALSACAGPQVTRVQPLSETADAPYGNVLVDSLFKSFDARRYLEKEIVKQLESRGVNAVARTSMMDSRTPVTRETFLAMVDSLKSDAVLVTQLVNLETEAKMKDARPEATYNIRPTYYYNVWSVDVKEYVEPQRLHLKHAIVLATQLYSVAKQEPVWAIESETNISKDYDEYGDLSVITAEAKAITSYLSRDGLLAP